jgi:hypothetical protein
MSLSTKKISPKQGNDSLLVESGQPKKISALTAWAPAIGTDLVPIARAGANFSLSLIDIATFINANGWERKGVANSGASLPTWPYLDGWAYFVSANGGTNDFLGTWNANCQPEFTNRKLYEWDIIVYFTGGFVILDNRSKYSETFTAQTTVAIATTTHWIRYPFDVVVYETVGTTDSQIGCDVDIDNTNGDVLITFGVPTTGRVVILG